MVRPTRIAATITGLWLGFGIAACSHSSASDDSASAGGPAASAGADGAGAGASGAEAAFDGGAVEQVDASTSCSDLFALARHQLDAAIACDVSAGSAQCTGVVAATCGCMLSVNSLSSAASASYLNTLSVIQAKQCVEMCPAEFCPAPAPAQCVAQNGGTGGVCVQRR